MSNVSNYLSQILSAVYGKDVRRAIYEAIKQCYDDVSNPTLNSEAFKTALSEAIEMGTLTALTVADASIVEQKIANGAVTAAKLSTNSVTTEKIVNAAISTAKLLDAAVTAAKLANGAVSFDKLADDVTDQFKHFDRDIETLQQSFKSANNNISQVISSAKTHANGLAFGGDGLLYLTHDGEVISAGVQVATGSGGGLSFNSGYQDEEGKIHLTMDGEDIEGFDPFVISGGSGGGGSAGSKLVFAMYSASAFSVLQTSKAANIRFRFSSVDAETQTPTGAGNLAVYVGGILKDTKTIAQGDNIALDVFEYLATGANTVKLVMTDSYGATATRTVTITVESFLLEWNLGDTEKNSGDLLIYVTPTGSGSKVLHLLLDGVEYETRTVTTSGRRIDFTLPLSVGSHAVSVYGTMTLSGVTLTSETLTCEVAEVSDTGTQIVIAAKVTEPEFDQYSTLNIPYRVINPSANPANVTFLVNDTVLTTETVDQAEHIWTYRATDPGSLKLAIRCGSVTWTKTVTINALSSDIMEVTDNLALKVDPNKITNLDSFNYQGTTFTVSSNFDSYNGGLQTDENGIRCIKVMKGDRLTINYPLFGVDSRINGRNIKLIYKVENASDFDGTAITCKNGNIGLTIQANSANMQTEQSSLEIPTCEGYKTELELNIEPDSENRLMMFWEKGTPTKATVYASNDNFRQTNAVGITVGSDTCDVLLYLVRVYTRDLTKDESKANYFADGEDALEITSRYDRNQVYDSSGKLDPDKVATLNPNLHVLTWHASGVSESKEQKITGSLTHKFVSGGSEHSWTAANVVQKAQGTSSLGYVQAGCNEDFELAEGITLEDGTHADVYSMTANSIGVNYFNFKTNVASQEHINNILLSEWYNRYQPHIRSTRSANSKVRDTIEGHMAVLFFHNTGETAVRIGAMTVQPNETVLYSLGCLNNSKKNNDVFKYDDIVIELRNNISDQCRFKSDDLTGEDWSGDVNFEFRYLNKDNYTEAQAQAIFQDFLSWVVSCDADNAPNTAFGTAKVINGQTYTVDSADYRKAKFYAEAADHMEVNSFLYHFLVTLVFSQVDNRAKNVFLAYNSTTGKWNVVFAYDNDTGMGNDNEGGLTLKYGYMDTDNIGTRAVFNASDSALWAMFRYCFATEIHNLYINRENAGAWNLDAFANLCDVNQDYACESLWIEDAWRKDIDTFTVLNTSAYIPMLNGKKRLQRRQFLHYQRPFMASYFVDAFAVSDSATIRGNTPTDWAGVEPASKMTITPYSDLWVTVMVGTTTYQKRAVAGEAVTLTFGTARLGDTEMYVRCAGFIADLGDLAPLYPGYTDLSPCGRLQKAQIGSSVSGYVNTNMTEISVKNAASLEYINVENCPNLSQELDLSNNINVKECYTRGSGVTGVTFAERGRLVTARLNALTSIYASRLNAVETFTLESFENLTTLNIVAGALNALAIAQAAVNVIRVRLKEMDWSTTIAAYKTLMRLHNANGIDDDGYNTDHGIITGAVYFTAITEDKLQTLRDTFPDIEFTYDLDQVLEEYTVKFCDGDGNVLHTQRVERGGSAVDPIAAGYISTPTKSSDVEYNYTYWKWDTNFEYIIRDTTITAQFTATDRFYTVTFANRDGSILEQHSVKAHGSCSYGGADPFFIGYIWYGWDGSADDVVADTTVTAQFIYPTLPAEVKDLSAYDFAYSDKESDRMAYNRVEFAGILLAGAGKTYFAVGDRIKMVPGNRVITDSEIVFSLHGFDHYKLSDGSGFAGTTWYAVGVLNATRQINSANTNLGGWPATPIRRWLNETLYPSLPPFWRSLIKQVQILSSAGNTTPDIVSSNDYLYLMSQAEVSFNTKEVPYAFEVDSGAECLTFTCYTDNNSRIKKYYNGTGDAVYWWLRSPAASSPDTFFGVTSGGSSYGNHAFDSFGVAPGFSI